MIAHATRRGAHEEYPQDASLTEGELAVVRWAEAARVEESMLRMVLDGTVGVDLHEGGEILFVVKGGAHATR